jgi:thiol-disulfide isomerase/thioredoxin
LPKGGTAIVVKTDDPTEKEIRIPVQLPPTSKANTKSKPRSVTKLLGKPAPAVTVQTHDMKEAKAGGSSEKVQLVTIYASWCGYCKKALPRIEKIYQDYKGKGLDVLAINCDSRSGRGARTKEQSIQAYNDLKLTMPMTLAAEQQTDLRKAFSMLATDAEHRNTGFPTFVLIGKDGTVEAVHVGNAANLSESLSSEIDQLLAGKKLATPAK